jgi:hypothetical protein
MAETDSNKAKITRASKANKPTSEANIPTETKKSSHKAAEQRRRDSLKAGFDELRLLLPPINTEALDPETERFEIVKGRASLRRVRKLPNNLSCVWGVRLRFFFYRTL